MSVRQDERVPEHEVISRAAERWAAGARADALTALRASLRVAPGSLDVRLALVERYRELGAPDQAGRWGLAVPGLTTTRERDRAARLFAASGVDEDELAEFIAMPDGSALPTEVVALLPDVDRYREAFRRKSFSRLPQPDQPGDPDGVLAGVGAGIAITWVVTAVVAWGGTVLGAQLTAFARWGSTVALGLSVLFCLLMLLRRGRRRRFGSAVAWGAACVALAVGVLRLVQVATEHDGVIRFAWER